MTADLLPLVADLADTPVLVLGDLMLDRYLWGTVSRISPEAPVQVLKVDREENRLGGAGSVVANLAALGARVHAFGVIGADVPGDRLLALLAEQGLDPSGLLRDEGVATTQKTRVIARAQHLLRIDRDAADLPQRLLDDLEQRALARLDEVAAVLLSDYGKGVFAGELGRRVAAAGRARGVPVLVDPHPTTPFERFAGATGMTPNRSETAGAVDIVPRDAASIRAAAEALIDRFDLDWAAVTLDRDGVFLLRRGQAGPGMRLPARSRDVFDVAGAGDMVLSVLGLAIAARAPLEDALALANVAAGWEVEHVGVLPITPDQLRAELRQTAPPELRRKIVDRGVAAARLDDARAQGKQVVFTNGCFDLLHAGHVHFLQGCRAKGDLLVVGLNTDESIRTLGKGDTRPVLPLAERSAVLAGLEAVDLVVPFGESTPIALIERLRPDVLCKGEDYRDKVVVGRELVEGYGGRVELVELLPGLSTTNIIARITSDS